MRRKLGWSQADFAIHLQLAGWNISRSGVARMEAQLVHVGDRELCYLRQVLRVDVKELFPALNPHKTFREGLAELLNKELAGELAPEPIKHQPRLASRSSPKSSSRDISWPRKRSRYSAGEVKKDGSVPTRHFARKPTSWCEE